MTESYLTRNSILYASKLGARRVTSSSDLQWASRTFFRNNADNERVEIACKDPVSTSSKPDEDYPSE
jgi:hypothetical protein